MSKCKKRVYAPKHCKGREPGWQKRKKKHQRFLRSEHNRLKIALADKLKVVKAVWKKHYAWVTFVGDVKDKFYCNFNYLSYLLRCRLFYKSAPFTFISQYFYFKIEQTEEGIFIIGDGNLKEKLIVNDQKEVDDRDAYLRSDNRFRDASKLCK
jgi:hypothetical protein